MQKWKSNQNISISKKKLYVNKEKSQTLFGDAGVQFATGLNNADSIWIIDQIQIPVKRGNQRIIRTFACRFRRKKFGRHIARQKEEQEGGLMDARTTCIKKKPEPWSTQRAIFALRDPATWLWNDFTPKPKRCQARRRVLLGQKVSTKRFSGSTIPLARPRG